MKRSSINTRKISFCLFILGILMIIIFIVINKQDNKTLVDEDSINWTTIKDGGSDSSNIIKYQNNDLKTITLNSIYNGNKNNYFINIPSDMTIQEYSSKQMIYVNNDLELSYNLGVTYDKKYDEYLDNIFSELYSLGNIYKYHVNDKIDAFLVKTMEDGIYYEKIIVILKDELYNKIELSLANQSFDKSLIKKIIDSIKIQNIEHYSRCDMYRCEMNLDNVTSKKIVYNQSREKYVNNITNMELGNELDYFRLVKELEFDAEIKLKMEYYRNQKEIDDIMNSKGSIKISMDKYNITKNVIEENTNEYKIAIDDNIVLIIDIETLRDNVNTEDILKDFLNFTYE